MTVNIKKFKTLGAKKYCYVDNDNKLHMTVSGVRKSAVSQLHNIEEFKDGTVFDVEHAQKLLMTYIDDMTPIVWIKGSTMNFTANINMVYAHSLQHIVWELLMIMSQF